MWTCNAQSGKTASARIFTIGPTHTEIEKHTFVANKCDYYDLNDGLPQFQP